MKNLLRLKNKLLVIIIFLFILFSIGQVIFFTHIFENQISNNIELKLGSLSLQFMNSTNDVIFYSIFFVILILILGIIIVKLAFTNDLAKEKELEVAVSKSKSEFIATINPELRTPLNGILGLTGLVLSTDLNTKQRDYMNKVDFSAKNLLRCINNIVDFSEIEAGKLDLELVNFDLEKVLDKVANYISIRTEEKNLELLVDTSKDVPLNLKGDSLRLEQILINLVNNAIKFTNKGEIIIKTELVSASDPLHSDQCKKNQVMLKFLIIDKEIELTKTQIDSLFQVVIQDKSSISRRYEETNLDLVISKKLVEVMGGKIWVEGESTKGNTFVFTAKFTKQEFKKQKQNQVPSDLIGLKTLIVDDNEASRQILKNYLTSFSFKVTEVDSGQKAIDMMETTFKNAPFDLILIDYKMPELDGIETAKQIKKIIKPIHVPIVLMVTSYSREKTIQDAYAYIDNFLFKPIYVSVLFNSIMEIFGKNTESDLAAKINQQKYNKLQKTKGAKILLVEDCEINQQVANELLEQINMNITIANNGKEAVEKIVNQNLEFDLVLMDLQMPEMDGYEATRIIRKNKSFDDLPIIALTAHTMEGERYNCLQAGMNDYLTKPIDTDKLHSGLIKWIKPREVDTHSTPDLTPTPSPISIPKKQTDDNLKNSMPDDLPGINVKQGIKCVGGNTNFYVKQLNNFNTKYKDIVDRLRNLHLSKKTTELERIAHTIKGIAGTISAKQLYEASSIMEKAAKENRFNEFDELLNNFDIVFNEVLESIEKIINANESDENNNDKKTDTFDHQSLEELFRKLNENLKKNEFDAISYLDPILKKLNDSSYTESLNRLKGYIINFDFNEAQVVLSEIAKSLNISL